MFVIFVWAGKLRVDLHQAEKDKAGTDHPALVRSPLPKASGGAGTPGAEVANRESDTAHAPGRWGARQPG